MSESKTGRNNGLRSTFKSVTTRLGELVGKEVDADVVTYSGLAISILGVALLEYSKSATPEFLPYIYVLGLSTLALGFLLDAIDGAVAAYRKEHGLSWNRKGYLADTLSDRAQEVTVALMQAISSFNSGNLINSYINSGFAIATSGPSLFRGMHEKNRTFSKEAIWGSRLTRAPLLLLAVSIPGAVRIINSLNIVPSLTPDVVNLLQTTLSGINLATTLNATFSRAKIAYKSRNNELLRQERMKDKHRTRVLKKYGKLRVRPIVHNNYVIRAETNLEVRRAPQKIKGTLAIQAAALAATAGVNFFLHHQ